MSRADRIRAALTTDLEPDHLDVIDESSGHNVPPGSESHFRVVVVSGVFDGMLRVHRHRRVHSALGEELANGMHALAIEALTPAQFEERGAQLSSPACRGGSRHDPAQGD